jgi:PleD family two-component response regulator
MFAATAHSAETPEEVAHTYIRAMADARINVVADQMHPSALDRFKGIMTDVATAIEAAPADRKPPVKMITALFGEEGTAVVKDLSPRDVFVRFMSNLTTFVPQIRVMHAGSEYQVLGHVDEGGNISHVVFRATLAQGQHEMTKMSVLSLKRDGEHWKMLLTDDLENLIAGLGKQLAAPPMPPPASAGTSPKPER